MCSKGIIFDLDGTLWEVKDITYQSVNEICKKYGLAEVSLQTICNVFGKNKEESAKMYFPNMCLEQSLNLMNEISEIKINNLNKYGGNVFENLEETLEELQDDYDFYIVSNTGHKEYIEAFLKSSNLEKYFKDYIAASERNVTKANGIKLIIEKHKLDKSVYVGDTKIDLESAKLVDIPFIYAKYGFEKNLDAKYSINSIKELRDIVKKINL